MNWYNNNNFGNNIPTYGYTQQPTTNMIFVSGYEDVVQRYQMPNTSVFYKHNDKDIGYIKTLDSKGQFQIKEYSLIETQPTKQLDPMDLSLYAKTTDLEPILSEIKALKEKIKGVSNGTTTRT